MTRVLLSLSLAVVGFLVLAGAIALLAYGAEPPRDGTLRVQGLESEAVLTWSESGEVSISADGESALWTGLGYAHAADHGWAMALWRQAALGQLSLWTGPEALELDRHARRLGFAAMARQSYATLAPEDREAIDAYARGVRRAFSDDAVAERDEFVQLDVSAEPWEPWHALAVERLVAWLGTSPFPTKGNGPEADFALADSLFRDALALGGLGHGRAYIAPTSGETDGFASGPALVYHQPYGASALPLLVGARLTLGSREQVVATIPGTLMLPAGSEGWAILLASGASIVRSDVTPPPPVFSRLADRDGAETLQQVLRDSSGLVLQPPVEAPPDTLALDSVTGEPIVAEPQLTDLGVRLRWSGFHTGSDVAAFRSLLQGREASFVLLRGDGLRLQDRTPVFLGSPPIAMEGEGWAYASANRSGAPAAQRLAALAADPNTPDGLAMDVGSPWALRQSRVLVRSLGNRDSLALDLQDAYAFIRGWDGLYTPEAIAPSIAEAWINAHREVFGRAPDPRQRADSALVAYTLRIGIARLRDSLGTTAGRWSWDRLAGHLRQPLLGGIPQFAPQPALAGGHPTSPLPGPSLLLDAPPGPAVFSFWTDGATARTHHPALPIERIRGRDSRIQRRWSRPSPDRPTLRLAPA